MMRRRVKFKKMTWILTPLMLALVFFYAGDFLALNQTPVKSNVIVVLGGGPEARVAQGVRLFHEGYASLLLMSGGAIYNPWQNQAEHMKQQAMALGVPANKILLETRSQTTLQNALFTRSLMEAHHLNSAIVVSSTFHMRRVWMDFSYAFHGTGIHLVYCSSPFPGFNPAAWWTTATGRKITALEYAKMVYTIGVDFLWRETRN